MFSDSSIRDIEVSPDAPYVSALLEKLTDLDKNRIHSSDDLVMRKAVLGLLEVVAQLEQRLAALEGPQARTAAAQRLQSALKTASPDELRLGE